MTLRKELILFWALIMFLVALFDKSARLLQWLVFFRQITELTLYLPLFGTEVNRFRGTHRSLVRVPASARNFFELFLDIVRFFKMVILRLKTMFFQWQHAISDYIRFFLRLVFFLFDFFF